MTGKEVGRNGERIDREGACSFGLSLWRQAHSFGVCFPNQYTQDRNDGQHAKHQEGVGGWAT